MSKDSDVILPEDKHKVVADGSLRQLYIRVTEAVSTIPNKDRKAFIKNELKIKPINDIPKHSLKDNCNNIAIIDYDLIQRAYRHYKRSSSAKCNLRWSNYGDLWRDKYFIEREFDVVRNGTSEESDLEKTLLDLKMSDISNDISDPEVLEICNNYSIKSFSDALCTVPEEFSQELTPTCPPIKADCKLGTKKIVKRKRFPVLSRRKKTKNVKSSRSRTLVRNTKKLSSDSSEDCLQPCTFKENGESEKFIENIPLQNEIFVQDNSHEKHIPVNSDSITECQEISKDPLIPRNGDSDRCKENSHSKNEDFTQDNSPEDHNHVNQESHIELQDNSKEYLSKKDECKKNYQLQNESLPQENSLEELIPVDQNCLSKIQDTKDSSEDGEPETCKENSHLQKEFTQNNSTEGLIPVNQNCLTKFQDTKESPEDGEQETCQENGHLQKEFAQNNSPEEHIPDNQNSLTKLQEDYKDPPSTESKKVPTKSLLLQSFDEDNILDYELDENYDLDEPCMTEGNVVNTEDHSIHSECNSQHSEDHSVQSENHSVHSKDHSINFDNHSLHSEDLNTPSEDRSAHSEDLSVHNEDHSHHSKDTASTDLSNNCSTNSLEELAAAESDNESSSQYSEVLSDSEKIETPDENPHGIERAGVASCYDPAILQKKILPAFSDDDDSNSDSEQSFKRRSNFTSPQYKTQNLKKDQSPSSSSMQPKVSQQYIRTFQDCLGRIRFNCEIHNIAEAVKVVSEYLPVSLKSAHTEILEELFMGIQSSVLISNTVPEESIENAFDILKKNETQDRRLCSLIIYKYFEQPLLVRFAVDLCTFCQKNKVPINNRAVQAYTNNAMSKNAPIHILLKFLEYVKGVCNLHYPKQLLSQLLERVPKGQESCLLPEFEQLCGVLRSLNVREFEKERLQKFVKVCVDNDCWDQVASFFRAWARNGELTDVLLFDLQSRLKDVGMFFKKFAAAVYGSGEPEYECTLIFGYTGLVLMLKAYFKGQSEVESNKNLYMLNAFEVFCTLQKYNINIYSLQQCFCSMQIAKRLQTELPDPSELVAFPFDVVFIATEVCLSLDRPKDAYHIVKGFAQNILQLPGTLNEPLKKSVRLRHLKYFLELSRMLQLSDPLDTGLKSFHDMLAFLKHHVILEDVGSFTKMHAEMNLEGIKTLFNEYLVSNMNKKLNENVLRLYRHMEGPCKTLLTLNPEVLRGVVVFLSKNQKLDEAISLFEVGCIRGIYGFKKNLTTEDFPWKITIFSHWTSQEMRLLFKLFLKTLFPVLLDKKTSIYFSEWFAVKITFEEYHSTPSQINCLMEQFSANESAMQRMCKVLRSIDPNLKWTENEEGDLILSPDPFYCYWKKNFPKSKEKEQPFQVSAAKVLTFGEGRVEDSASSDLQADPSKTSPLKHHLPGEVSSTTNDSFPRGRLSRSSSDRSSRTPEPDPSTRLPQPFLFKSPTPVCPPHLENSIYATTRQRSSSRDKICPGLNSPRESPVLPRVQQSPRHSPWSPRKTSGELVSSPARQPSQSPKGAFNDQSPDRLKGTQGSPSSKWLCDNRSPGRSVRPLELPSPKNVCNDRSPSRSSIHELSSPKRALDNNQSPGRSSIHELSAFDNQSPGRSRTKLVLPSPQNKEENQCLFRHLQSPKQTEKNNSPGRFTTSNCADPVIGKIPPTVNDETSGSGISLPIKKRLRPNKNVKKSPIKKTKKIIVKKNKKAAKVVPLSNFIVVKNFSTVSSLKGHSVSNSSLINHSPELSVFSEPRSRLNKTNKKFTVTKKSEILQPFTNKALDQMERTETEMNPKQTIKLNSVAETDMDERVRSSPSLEYHRPEQPFLPEPRSTLKAKRRLNMNAEVEIQKLPPYRIPTPCKQIKVIRPVTPSCKSFNSRYKTPITFTSAPQLSTNIQRPIPNAALNRKRRIPQEDFNNSKPDYKDLTKLTVSLQGNRKRITTLGGVNTYASGSVLQNSNGPEHSMKHIKENFEIKRNFIQTDVEDYSSAFSNQSFAKPIFKLPQSTLNRAVPDADFHKILTFVRSKVRLKCRTSTQQQQEEQAQNLATTFIQENSVSQLDTKTMKLLYQFAETCIYET